MDDETDTFTIETRWKASTAALRLWCLLHRGAAIDDAGTISTWQDAQQDVGTDCVVVEDDVAELHLPLEVFRKLATPREATVYSPAGKTIAHVDGVDATTLIAAILTFTGQAYMRRIAADGIDT